MPSHGSSSATLLSSTATAPFSNHMMSSSISSLSSASQRHSPNSTSKAYRQASTLFLTRRLPEALSTVLPLVTPPPPENEGAAAEPAPVARSSRNTRVKVWSLYLTTLNAIVELEPEEGKDAFGAQEWRSICSKVRDGVVWEEVVQNGYHGVEGDVDSDVVINLATLLLAHARTQQLNQKRLESYLAASQTPNLDLTNKFQTPSSPRIQHRYRSPSKGPSGADTPRDLNARVKILELYTLHVLLRNNEWDYAREFISVSSVLDEERREAFLQALQSLQEEQQLAEQQERDERQRQEEQLQKDLEEARRLRAENEQRERKRIEQERARREGSEVDYGIDGAPRSPGGSSAAGKGKRHARTPSSALSRPARPPAKKTVAPSFGSRATAIISNLRVLVEQMAKTLSLNPVLLMRLVAFIVGLLFLFSRQDIRQRIRRILGNSWAKVMATAGMGVKVSYI